MQPHADFQAKLPLSHCHIDPRSATTLAKYLVMTIKSDSRGSDSVQNNLSPYKKINKETGY